MEWAAHDRTEARPGAEQLMRSEERALPGPGTEQHRINVKLQGLEAG